MSVWMKNLRMFLEDREVIILHGNVRDKYIHSQKQVVYENLTDLLKDVIAQLPISFSRLVFYDMVKKEQEVISPKQCEQDKSGEFSSTSPHSTSSGEKATPSRILAKWLNLLADTSENTATIIFYLDKLISYKTNYLPEERELILRIEKLIENISPNNRLIMVALTDSLIPVELYLNSPKVSLLSIPMPDTIDRSLYLSHRLGLNYPNLELISNLSEGLFLRQLDAIMRPLREKEFSSLDIRKIINKYKLGEREDYWSLLNIEKLDTAPFWFTQEKGVKAQDEAVKKVIETLVVARAGLSGLATGTISRPKGVLFFCGPTGVGKTFLAKKLAEFLFSSEKAFIRFDMSEYKESHTTAKFIGSPPGFVGYEMGGQLTSAMRQRPFSVVLFDEIEKAHPLILDLFLQIIDEGRLTDSRGQTVFFTETVIVFTSNIGTRTIDSMGKDMDEREDLERLLKDKDVSPEDRRKRIKGHFVSCVERYFSHEIARPELLNRIGNNIVPFNYIDTKEAQEQIIFSHLNRIKTEVEEKYKGKGYRIEFHDSLPKLLIKKYGDKFNLYGGRGITNAIDGEIMLNLSFSLLRADYQNIKETRLTVKAIDGKVKVTFD